MHKTILIVGLFRPINNLTKPVTASQQLAELFQKNNIPIIQTSFYQGRIWRMIDTLLTILFNARRIQIAIVPMFGTKPSFIWQELTTRLLKILNIPIILVMHGGSIPEKMKKNSRTFLSAFERADKIVCPSTFLQTSLKQYNIESTVIENVLDLSAYLFVHKTYVRPRIIWMRSFSDIYNPQMAVRVASLLAKKYPHFYMIMAGNDGGLLSSIQAMVKENNLDHVIKFTGFINQSQKQELAYDFDIYICTNRIDNAPVSVIEFMSLGLPIVSVNTGGLPYLINNEINGLLVSLDDDNGMVTQIEKLMNYPSLSSTITQNALDYSGQYDEVPVLKKWALLFSEMDVSFSESIKSIAS